MATTTKPRASASKTATKGEAPIAATAPGDRLTRIPVASVRPSPYQPRRVFDDTPLGELADSMAASGLLQPITVRVIDAPIPTGGVFYELVAGERRWRAAQRLAWAEIPAVVKVMT